MTRSQAENWVIVSAATVGGTYAYLKWKGEAKTPVGEMVTAWGVVYFTLALVATAAPGVGAGLAIIIMTSDLLANTPKLVNVLKAAGIPTSGQTSPTPKGAPSHG